MVLPIYRNLPQLAALLARLTAVLDTAATRWEVVCVDDAGGDGAREWLAARAATDERVRPVENPRNLGQHASIVRGLAAARGERTVVMDADLQDAPEDIPRLLAAWRPGLGAVFARRRHPYQGALRDWSGRQFKRLMRALTGDRLPRGVGTFVLIGGEAKRRVVAAAGEQPYLPLLLARADLPLVTVDIDKHPRVDGGSAYTPVRRLRLALRSLAQAVRWRLGRR